MKPTLTITVSQNPDGSSDGRFEVEGDLDGAALAKLIGTAINIAMGTAAKMDQQFGSGTDMVDRVLMHARTVHSEFNEASIVWEDGS